MTGFRLDGRGDVVLDQDIALAAGAELTAQTAGTVLGTNCGEWFLNPAEGIRFRALMGKTPDPDVARAELQAGLRQVDAAFLVTEFSVQEDRARRVWRLAFTARNAAGETIQEVKDIAY